MAPSLLITKMPMSPHRVMGMVLAVAIMCVVFSAFRAPTKTPKLGALLEQPSAAAVDGLHVKVGSWNVSLPTTLQHQSLQFLFG